MLSTRSSNKTRSGQLLNHLSFFERFVIVMHDNPDPDAIASGWGIQALIEEKLAGPVKLVGGGAIVRAENRHMVELLMPPIELVDEIFMEPNTAVILVDCGVGTTNHLVTRQSIDPVAVIDHHDNRKQSMTLSFEDVRPNVAASTSIVASYLREQKVEPGEKLATAMLYAIRTETCGFETHHTDLDKSMVLWLTQWADPAVLAEIDSAPLSMAYFTDLALALQTTRVFADAAFCLLPRAEGAEIVGELADLLVRCHKIKRVLSGAKVGSSVLVSVRTEREGDNAAELVQKVLAGIGSGGGHAHRAGGKIPDAGPLQNIDRRLEEELRSRWLDSCGIVSRKATRLIARKDIIGSL